MLKLVLLPILAVWLILVLAYAVLRCVWELIPAAVETLEDRARAR